MHNHVYSKEDTNALINEFGKLNAEDEFLFRFLSKKIIFLKETKISIVNITMIFYIDQMVSDLMYLMASYHKGEVRYLYSSIRSVIEAFSCLFNEVETNTNRITMTALLNNIANYITLNDLRDSKEDSLDYPKLKGLYRECCLYVHGNINAKYSLIEFYNELLNEEITNVQKRKMSNDIKFSASILANISCYRYSVTLSDVFFRGKSKLGYLIGESGVKIVKSYSNFTFSCLSGGESIYNVVLTSKKGSKLKVIDFNSDEYGMSYCSRPDTLPLEDYDVYSKCILKKKSYCQKDNPFNYCSQ